MRERRKKAVREDKSIKKRFIKTGDDIKEQSKIYRKKERKTERGSQRREEGNE
jgi:hypothetical protein